MDDTYRLVIRLTPTQAARLRDLARRENRSLNAQIATLIERADTRRNVTSSGLAQVSAGELPAASITEGPQP